MVLAKPRRQSFPKLQIARSARLAWRRAGDQRMLPVQLEEVIATCPGARVLMSPAPSSLAISGVSHDSRVVQDGDLFACIGGKEHDGTHALEAAKTGAAALWLIVSCQFRLPKLSLTT